MCGACGEKQSEKPHKPAQSQRQPQHLKGDFCASDRSTFEPFRLSQTAQSVAGVTISNSQSDRLVRDGTSFFHAVIRCALPVNRQQASQLFYMCPSPSISDDQNSGKAVGLCPW